MASCLPEHFSDRALCVLGPGTFVYNPLRIESGLQIKWSAGKDLVAKRKRDRAPEHYITYDPLAGRFSHDILTYSNCIILSRLSLCRLLL